MQQNSSHCWAQHQCRSLICESNSKNLSVSWVNILFLQLHFTQLQDVTCYNYDMWNEKNVRLKSTILKHLDIEKTIVCNHRTFRACKIYHLVLKSFWIIKDYTWRCLFKLYLFKLNCNLLKFRSELTVEWSDKADKSITRQQHQSSQ